MSPKPTSGRPPAETPGRPAGKAGTAPGVRTAGAGESRQGGSTGLGGLDPGAGGDLQREEGAWPLGFRDSSRSGSDRLLTTEVGAALERDLLLAGTTEDAPPGRGPRTSRKLTGLILGFLALAVLGSGVFFFLESRRTWEGRIEVLEGELQSLREDSAAREQSLRESNAEKDAEIVDWRARVDSLTALADRTIQELKTSLEDLRQLRAEKQELEAGYRELVRKQRSPMDYFFSHWLPAWLRESRIHSQGE